MPDLTLLDFLMLGGLAIGVWQGTRTGAMKQVAGVVGLILALWLGAVLMIPAGAALVEVTRIPAEFGPVVGFISVATLVMVGAGVIAYLARKLLVSMRLGSVDRGLGAFFGGTRMAVLISVLLLVTSAPMLPGGSGVLFGADARQQSMLYGPLSSLAPALWNGLRANAPGWQVTLQELAGPSMLGTSGDGSGEHALPGSSHGEEASEDQSAPDDLHESDRFSED